MISLLQLLHMAIGFYMWVLIIGAIISWLTVFNVINNRNAFVRQLDQAIRALTEPALRQIRRFVPAVNGVDLSFLVLYFLLLLAQLLIQNNIPMVRGML
jgi:YggT family protein